MNVLALDLSLTAIGWAERYGGIQMSGSFAPRYRGVERLADVAEWLDGRLGVPGMYGMVVLEGYSFASKGRAVVSMGELGGVVRLWLYDHAQPFAEIPPSCRAKLATGKGNASKDAVLVEAVKRLAYPGSDHNEADALWLLQAALHHYQLPGRVELPKAHLDGLTKIVWPELSEAA